MPLLTREQVASIVFEALEKVAGLPADPENAPFDQMQTEHQKVFLTALREILRNTKVNPADPADNRYYEVILNMEIFESWKIVKDCIDYIFENQMVVYP